MGRDCGLLRGKGGSMHLTSVEHGAMGSYAIIGAHLPIAAGAAWSAQYRGTGQVAVCFFGDGTTNIGAFHEALNFAVVWKLPVVFVCENNVYGFSTHYRRVMVREDIADRAAGYGMPGEVVDGMDAAAVYAEAGKAVERARAGKGPTLLECKTYRFMGHSRFEPSSYRTREELEEWKQRDPLPLMAARLRGLGVPEAEIAAVDGEAAALMDDAVRFAESSPDPAPDEWKRYIYA
jgi:pyruvate dehydrogenase E1 component alpha subunit